MSEKTIYLSGPMRGVPEFNFPAFNAVALRLRLAGWRVLNPADLGYGSGDYATGTGVTEDEVQNWLRQDIRFITESDAIALLPGWEESEGAQLEVAVGYRLGLDFYEADTMSQVELHEEIGA